jgi:hypothetical protein
MFIKREITLQTSEATGGQILKSMGFTGVFDKVFDGAVDELAGAIYDEMETIKGKSQDIVPKRFGTLEASADAVGVNLTQSGSRGSVVIGYGGAASAYTFLQHETPPPGEGAEDEEGNIGLEFRHAPGRMWKFLETPVMEAVEGMEGRIAIRLRKRLSA